MAVGIFVIWVAVGDTFFNKIDVAKLKWGLGRKNAEESLVNCSFVSFLDYLV